MGAYGHEVWCSTDGKSWTCADARAKWPVRIGHAVTSFDGKVWILGGQGAGNLNDVWYSSSLAGVELLESQVSRKPAVLDQKPHSTMPFIFSKDGTTDYERGMLNLGVLVRNPTNSMKWVDLGVSKFTYPDGRTKTGLFCVDDLGALGAGQTREGVVVLEPPHPLLVDPDAGEWQADVVLRERNSVFGTPYEVGRVSFPFTLKPKEEVTVEPPAPVIDVAGGTAVEPDVLSDPQQRLYYEFVNSQPMMLLHPLSFHLYSLSLAFFGPYFDFITDLKATADEVHGSAWIRLSGSPNSEDHYELTVDWSQVGATFFRYDRALVFVQLPQGMQRQHVLDPGLAKVVEGENGSLGLLWIVDAVDKKIWYNDRSLPHRLHVVLDDASFTPYRLKASLLLQIGPFQNADEEYAHLRDAPWVYDYDKWQTDPFNVYWMSFSAMVQERPVPSRSLTAPFEWVVLNHTLANDLVAGDADLHMQAFTFDDTVTADWAIDTLLPPPPPGTEFASLGYQFSVQGAQSVRRPFTVCLPWIDSLADDGHLGVFHYDSAGRTWRLLSSSIADTALHKASATAFEAGLYAILTSEDSLPLLPAVELRSPVRDTMVADYTPSFGWEDTSYLDGFWYQLQMDTTAGFAEPLFTMSEDSTDGTMPDPTQPGTYHWRVRRCDYSGFMGEWSPAERFTIIPVPEAPELVSPGHMTATADSCPLFAWSPVEGDTFTFTLQCALNDSFTSGLAEFAGLTDTTFRLPVGSRLADTTYYWRVRAVNQYGTAGSYQDGPYHFKVDSRPPPPPVLVYPNDGSRIGSYWPTFVWQPTDEDWDRFVLQVSADSLFNDSVMTFPDIYETTYRLGEESPLLETTYFWRVKTIDCAGNQGDYVAHPFRLTVDTLLPSVPLPLSPSYPDAVFDSLPTFLWSANSNDTSAYGKRELPPLSGKVAAAGLMNGGTGRAVMEARAGHLSKTVPSVGIRRSGPAPVGPVSYTVQVAGNDSFIPCVVETTGVLDTVLTLPPGRSLMDSMYYWRVEAVDSAGNHSGYSWPLMFEVRTTSDISGRVRYYSNQRPVGEARVMLSGAAVDTTATDSLGQYAVCNLPVFQDYRVEPSKKESSRSRAVGAYDAALVLAYAVRRGSLDSLQRVAANVSGDEAVSAYDAALILQYAVGRIQHFPVGARPGDDTVDWGFRPAARNYDSLLEDQADQDYKGILYGDPSGNWPGIDMLVSSRDTSGEATFFSLNIGDDNGQVEVQYDETAVTLSGSDESKCPSAPTPDATQLAIGQLPNGAGAEPSVVYTVRANGARDVVAADMLVKYDANRLTLDAVRTTAQTDGFMVAATDRGGYVRISMAGTRRLNGKVELLELAFEPATGVAAQTPILKLRAPASDGTLNQETSPTSEAVSRGPSAVGAVPIGPVPEPSAVSREPLANIVWLVLNEGMQPGSKPTEEGAMAEKRHVPMPYFLSQPKPNPFGGIADISYGLPQASEVKVAVFDATGRRVRLLVDGVQAAGRHALTWDGCDVKGRVLANGVYFVRMQADRFKAQRKVTVVRH
jgi:hypothetical protein